MNKPAKFYFFFHFHKCAGSSAVAGFRAAGYRLNEKKNGNLTLPESSPHPSEGGYPSWELLSRENQEAEIRGAASEGYTFLAAERTFPAVEAVRRALPGVHTFTILRDPWERFVSNYRFSMWGNSRRGKPVMSLADYGKSGHYGAPNFFVRTVLGRTRDRGPLTKEDLTSVRAWAQRIDSVVVLEDSALENWFEDQGLPTPKEHLKKAPAMEGLEFNLDKSEFKKRNQTDYDFYSYVREALAWRPGLS